MNKGSQGLAPYQASLNGARLFDPGILTVIQKGVEWDYTGRADAQDVLALFLYDERDVDSCLHKFRILEVYKVKFQNGEYYEKCRNLRLDVIKQYYL